MCHVSIPWQAVGEMSEHPHHRVFYLRGVAGAVGSSAARMFGVGYGARRVGAAVVKPGTAFAGPFRAVVHAPDRVYAVKCANP